MIVLRVAFLSLLVVSTAHAAPEARLPDYVRPLDYKIEIAPDAAAPTFAGKVELQFETTKPITTLTLNAIDLTFDTAEIDGVAATVAIDPEAATATFTPLGPITLGKHIAKFAYRGKISTNAYGLFSSTALSADGGKKRLLATQFESSGARRMFPSFDEPGFKSVFNLTAIVPQDEVAISNMPIEASAPEDGRKRVTFARTPVMSSYLLFLAVGDYESIEGQAGNTKVAVWTPRGAIHRAHYALDATIEVLTWFSDYFAMPYPLPKLDMVATPTARGAMENWGAIRFSDAYLLIDDGASQQRKQQVWSVIAHEVAHMWFGDLVTMQWWDDLWLNEGFATWASGAVAKALHPEWNVEGAHARSRDRVMQQDSRKATHPIVQHITTTAEIGSAFDDITYQKGAAVIRMLEGWLTPDTFRAGIRAYMKQHAYGNTVTSDLWDALATASKRDVRAVADSFTRQPGVPLVSVDRCAGARDELTLKQERFAATPTTKLDPLAWDVPVSAVTIDGRANSAIALAEPMLRAKLAGCTPARVNHGGTGWYRTSYTPALAQAIADAFPQAAAVDRVVLLDDSWALAVAGRSKVDPWLELVTRLGSERDASVWGSVADDLLELDAVARGMPERAKLRAWAIAQLRPGLTQVGWDARANEPPRDTLTRETLLAALSRLGDPAMRAEARKRYDAAGGDPAKLGSLATVTLDAVARGADAATFDRLFASARSAPSFLDAQLVFDALGTVEDPALVKKLLDATLTDAVPMGLRRRIIGRIAEQGDHTALAWDFSNANTDNAALGVDTRRRWAWAPGIARRFIERDRADALRDFAKKNAKRDEQPEFERAAEEIELRADRRTRLIPAVASWIETHTKS
ncbi:M1 family metallopeptidase [Roseiterribacter gracilis]|uniref:Aminopeptidase n=1 Tax=Roseiterribacter gracilis TaxID=2812848 RepID=A0A8S8XGV2_9PROT|nr:aminopeptidase [Rhodospirillales bacterium TMPK1]